MSEHVQQTVFLRTAPATAEASGRFAEVGARRTPDGGWAEALSPAELRRAVHQDLDQLGLDVLDVVVLRMPGMGDIPVERSLAEPLEALVELRQEGLVRHVGVSHVTATQVAEALGIAPLACVEHDYNLINRADDDLIDDLARRGIAYVAVQGLSYTTLFRVRGLTPEQSAVLEAIAQRVGGTPEQVAMAWLLARRTCCSSRAPPRWRSWRSTSRDRRSCSTPSTWPSWTASARPGHPAQEQQYRAGS
jgi:aryl-alcohol dehydrogenase-like predicted oxidoreductase